MSTANKNPITPELLAKLADNQRQLNDILKDIENAEYCGIDCQSLRAERDARAMQIERLLEKYGSNPAQRLPQK